MTQPQRFPAARVAMELAYASEAFTYSPQFGSMCLLPKRGALVL